MSSTQMVPGEHLGRFIDWDMEQSEDPVSHAPTLQLVFTFETEAESIVGVRRAPLYMSTSSDAARSFVLGVVEAISGVRFESFAAFMAAADTALQRAKNQVRLVFVEETAPNGTRQVRLKYVNRAAFGFRNSIRGDRAKRAELLLALQAQEATSNAHIAASSRPESDPPTTLDDVPSDGEFTRQAPSRKLPPNKKGKRDDVTGDDIPF